MLGFPSKQIRNQSILWFGFETIHMRAQALICIVTMIGHFNIGYWMGFSHIFVKLKIAFSSGKVTKLGSFVYI